MLAVLPEIHDYRSAPCQRWDAAWLGSVRV